jgi:hypothetical protein
MLRIGSVVWGVRDVARAVEFWTAALDYVPRGGDSPDWVLLRPRRGTGVQLALQEVKAEASQRRRHHLDLYAYDHEAEVERLLGLGASRVDWRYPPDSDYVVLADPDGNYFCVIAAGEAARDPSLRIAEGRGPRFVFDLADLPGDDFAYRGARALVALHERELRAFLPAWRRFAASGQPLPETDETDYQSNEHLLRHVLRAAGRYLTWVCKHLDLPDPGMPDAPPVETIAAEAEAYMEQVLALWRTALTAAPPERMADLHTSNWGEPFTIESMLEHAVVHPMRHTLQLEELLARAAAGR